MKKKYIFNTALFLFSFLSLVIFAPFGYSFNDEPFIVSLAQRLHFGDSLFVDEWHVTQNFGVVILPLYKLYLAIFGSTEGILLCFRIIYCFIWVSVCTVVYNVLKKKYRYCIVPYLYLLFFSPLDQMTLSYTSIGLSCALILACLFFYHFEIKNIKLNAFVTVFSLFTVILVICLPFAAAVYFLFAVSVLIVKKIRPSLNAAYMWKVVIYSFCFFVFALALYLFVFVLSDHSFYEFTTNIPKALFDSSHSVNGTFRKIATYIYYILRYYKFHCVVIAVSLILSLIPKIRKSFNAKAAIFLINVTAFAVQMIYMAFNPEFFLLNHQMVPIVFLGIVSAFLINEYKQHAILFVTFIVWGIIYSVLFHFASDTGLMAISMGLSVSGVGGIIYISLFLKECKDHFNTLKKSEDVIKISHKVIKNAVVCFTFATFILQVSVCMHLKAARHYLDVSPLEMDSVITQGASKGLITTEANKLKYDRSFSAVTSLLKNTDPSRLSSIRFLSLISDPVVYLNADVPFATHSSWTFGLTDEALVNKHNEYYKMHPDNVPNVIFGNSHSENLLKNLELDTTDFTAFYYDEYFMLISKEVIADQK